MIGDREESLELDVEIDQVGLLNLNVFLMEVRELLALEKQWPLFFFDHSLGAYTFVGEETLMSAHFTAIICESTRISSQTPSRSSASPDSLTRCWRTLPV